MVTQQYLHGIETKEVDDDIRPIQTGPSNVIGLVGTAPDADPELFPINTPILIAGDPRHGALLGATGTIPDALTGIFDEFGADVVVVRVEENEDFDAQLSNIIGIQSSLTGIYALKKARPLLGLIPKLIIVPGFTEYRPADGIASVTVNTGGTGATQAGTTVAFTGGAGYGATAVPVVQNGAVVAITMKSKGWGYKEAHAANGKFTFSANPAAGTKITLNGTDVTFVAAGAAGNQVNIGVSLGATLTALATFLNASADVQITKNGYVASATVLTITSEQVNASGNTFAISTNVAGAVSSGAFLAGGIDPVQAVLTTDGTGATLTPVLGTVANPVVAAMTTILTDMRSVMIADLPNTTYADEVSYRGDFDSQRLWLVAGDIQTWDVLSNSAVTGPVAAHLAGKQAYMDFNRGFWWSASNQALSGVVGVGRPIDWSFTSPTVEGQLLNSQGIAVVVRDNGIRVMGTQAPTSDTLWQFLPVRRTVDMVEDATEAAIRIAIDRPLSLGTFDFIEGTVNAYLRSLVNDGALLGGRCWLDRTVNSVTELQAGHLTMDYDLEPPAPLTRLTFRVHRNAGYYTELIDSFLLNASTAQGAV